MHAQHRYTFWHPANHHFAVVEQVRGGRGYTRQETNHNTLRIARLLYLTVPPVLTSPLSSGWIPMSTFRKVVFPTPFPPTIPMRSPLSNS